MNAGPKDTVPVTLFDYGVGNLHSIKKALERSGAQVTVTHDGEELLQAEAIVLPGVGAFGASMRPLEPVRDRLRERLEQGAPCLAVCIGMQLLFEASEESPGTNGIGLLPGIVRALPRSVGKVPHLGWNTLEVAGQAAPSPWRTLLPESGTYAYFVHSYLAPPTPEGTLAVTHYGEGDQTVEIPAVIAQGNTLATQFHPEKSSAPGLRLIERWVQRLQDPPTPRGVPHDPSTRACDPPTRACDPPTRPKGPEGKH